MRKKSTRGSIIIILVRDMRFRPKSIPISFILCLRKHVHLISLQYFITHFDQHNGRKVRWKDVYYYIGFVGVRERSGLIILTFGNTQIYSRTCFYAFLYR